MLSGVERLPSSPEQPTWLKKMEQISDFLSS